MGYNRTAMEIFGIGIGEMMVIALVALIFLGPDRLPEVARSLGKGVAEIRRATEPARSAWNDLTSEINTEINKVTAVSGNVKGNPWQVHPIMEKMTPEERERFMSGGDIPPAIAAELSQLPPAQGDVVGNSALPQVQDLDYPMPHTEGAFQAARAGLPPMEDLDYPVPSSSNGHSEPAES